jgi:GalNAc5-diNAcBac-PP-undecaprenol beta-1,3-glucosyltransferase
MKDPFFSIVIPVYNRSALLQETVKSIHAQTFSSYEIIIVDDGSTDGSGPEIDRLYGNVSNIVIIHQPNQERGASRNNGFKKATGEYVIFLDSDDLLLPVHLEVLYNKIQDLNNPDFISTKYDFLRNGKRVRSIISDSAEGYYDYRFFLNGNPYGCNVCVRRLNEKLCLFEEDRRYSIKEDWLFFLENLQGQKIYLIDQVTLLMVDHDERSMRQNDRILVEKTFLSREWILKRVKLNEAETRQLDAHVNYFCAIHSYLDFRRRAAFNFLIKAFNNNGIRKKYLVLLAKIIIGRKAILKLFP